MDRVEKKNLRKEILAQRRALTPSEVERMSFRVLDRLSQSGLLERPLVVALYAAADGEIRTRPLFEKLRAAGKTVVLPRVRGQGPEVDFFRVTDWDLLERSALGIPEPGDDGHPVPPEEFDLVLVPGVAFDRAGGRLGYGMGCYDRVLCRVRPGTPLVGIGYDFQVAENLPMEPHDVPLTAVVCESAINLPADCRESINHKSKGEKP